MVYKCASCDNECWSDEAPYSYKDGGSGVIVCPECEGPLNMVRGEIEESILQTLAEDDEAMSMTGLSNETGYQKDVVRNSLRHLIDMGYIGTTPGWDYRLSTKAREKYC